MFRALRVILRTNLAMTPVGGLLGEPFAFEQLHPRAFLRGVVVWELQTNSGPLDGGPRLPGQR